MLKKALKRELDFNDPITKEKITKTCGDVIILQLVAAAMRGDLSAAREILDRIEGRTSQTNINLVQGDQINNTLNITPEQGEKLDAFILDTIGRESPRELGDMEHDVPEDQGPDV